MRHFGDGKFIVKHRGRWYATALLPVLLVVEATDVVFAVDSIPAIFAVTRDPFIVFTSNIFAILGLRALYFVLKTIMDAFRFLKVGLGLVLVFVGAKMCRRSGCTSAEISSSWWCVLEYRMTVRTMAGANRKTVENPPWSAFDHRVQYFHGRGLNGGIGDGKMNFV